MKISVIMPVYNEAELVGEAVDCILAQTTADWECIILDDGSTDETPEILEAMARRDPRLRIIHGPRQGIAASLNQAIDQARGQYLARMDADDLCSPERLQKQARFLDENPHIGLVSCVVRYGGDASKFRGLAHFVEWTNVLKTPGDIYLNRFVESPLIHPSVMFRRSVWEDHGGYGTGDFPEDYDLWLRWLEAGVRMARIPEPLFTWRERDNRLTRTDPRCSTLSFFRCKAPFLARWLERVNPHHPQVHVWGAGREARRRLVYLKNLGIRVQALIDVDKSKIGKNLDGHEVISYQNIPPKEACFVLSFVGNRGARVEIEAHLESRGFQKGRHYICGA